MPKYMETKRGIDIHFTIKKSYRFFVYRLRKRIPFSPYWWIYPYFRRNVEHSSQFELFCSYLSIIEGQYNELSANRLIHYFVQRTQSISVKYRALPLACSSLSLPLF